MTISGSLDLKAIREEYECVFGFALFSGGHDSLSAVSVAFEQGAVESALHIDTGIGVPETQEFVRETCKKMGWPLRVYSAKECGQDWEEMIRQFGFPGPAMHNRMYQRLKERALRVAIREARPARKRILLVSGCRSKESVRRMGTVKPVDRQGTWVWAAPLHDWDKETREAYIEQQGLQKNPVVLRLGKSGECLCGAFAKKGELDEIAEHYPEVAERIMDLEDELRNVFPWGWEDAPPKGWKTPTCSGKAGYLCHGCEKHESNQGM